MNECLEARLGVSLFHQFFDQFGRRENHALAGPGHMRAQTVFNGVPLGAIRRIMRDADFDADLISQDLEVLFEEVMARTITAPAITGHQDRSGIGVVPFPVGEPPMTKASTSEFTGIVAGTNLDIADIETHIIETMRDAGPAAKLLKSWS